MAHPICVSLLILTKSLQTQLIGMYSQRKEIQALQVQQGRQVRLVPQVEQDLQAHLALQVEQDLRDLQAQPEMTVLMVQQVLQDQPDLLVLQGLQARLDHLALQDLQEEQAPTALLVQVGHQAQQVRQAPQAPQALKGLWEICLVFSWTFQPQQAELQVQVSSISIMQLLVQSLRSLLMMTT
jgi:hypothetical protein